MQKEQKLSLMDISLPDSTPVEEKLLVALLRNESEFNSSLITLVSSVIDDDCFTSVNSKKCWQYITKRVQSHQSVGLIQLGAGNKYLINRLIPRLTDNDTPVTQQDVMIFACELRRMQLQREMMTMLSKGVQMLNDYPDIDMMQLYASTWQSLANRDYEHNSGRNELNAIFNELADELSKPVSFRISTPWNSLNYFTFGGFRGGNLVVLAARPGVGKSTLALQMAIYASNNKQETVFYALEMTRTELAEKMITSTGYVQPTQIFSHTVNWENYEAAVSKFSSDKLLIYDGIRKLDAICNSINKLCQVGKCKIAFIDYLQLIKPTGISPRDNRVTQIAEITSTLKGLAIDNKIVIVLMSQLNRASASENRPPELFDLRESGSIEQDADIVLMLEKSRTTINTDNAIDMYMRKGRACKIPKEPITLIGDDHYANFLEINTSYSGTPNNYYDTDNSNTSNEF